MSNYRTSCNYITDTWTTNEHLNGCNEPTCPGCRPCEHDHCELRGCPNHTNRTTGIWTCPSCIGRTRRDLKTIVRLMTFDIPAETIDAGIESEAMNLAGTATIALPIDSRRGWCAWPPTETHPYTVLAGWELALREEYGPNSDLSITIPRAADYLDLLLNQEFPHTRRFEDFARDVRRCRTHLEAVIHDSRAPETGAPCPECGDKAPKLIKRYGPTENDDAWHCPDNPGQHSWTNAAYWQRIEGDYLNPDEWMPAKDAAEKLGISIGALKVRATRKPKGRSRLKGLAVYSIKVLAS